MNFNKVIIGLSVLVVFSSYVNAVDSDVSFPKIKRWKLKVSSDVYTPDNLWDLINGAAESYLSYDFIDLHLADYKSKSGVEIHVEIYRHSSAANAFGIYSSERSPEYNFVEVGVQGYVEEGILNFNSGKYYIKLYTSDSGEEVEESLLLISRGISDHLGEDNTWPELLATFPPKGKIPNRDHYVRENFIGFDFLHSAYSAEYEGGYRLFVIHARDREEVIAMAKAYLKFTRQDIEPDEVSEFTIKDRYNGDIPVVLSGNYLAGIVDGPDNQEALANLKELVKILNGK